MLASNAYSCISLAVTIPDAVIIIAISFMYLLTCFPYSLIIHYNPLFVKGFYGQFQKLVKTHTVDNLQTCDIIEDRRIIKYKGDTNMKNIKLVALIALLSMVAVGGVCAQGPSDTLTVTAMTIDTYPGPYPTPATELPADFNTLPGLFAFMATGGFGVLLSEWLRKNEKYNDLPADTKQSIAFGLPILSALLGRALLDFVPQEFIVAVQPYWYAFCVGVMAAAAANMKHRWENR